MVQNKKEYNGQSQKKCNVVLVIPEIEIETFQGKEFDEWLLAVEVTLPDNKVLCHEDC